MDDYLAHFYYSWISDSQRINIVILDSEHEIVGFISAACQKGISKGI